MSPPRSSVLVVVLATSLVACTRPNPNFLASADGEIAPHPGSPGAALFDAGGPGRGTGSPHDGRLPGAEPASGPTGPAAPAGFGALCTTACAAGELCLFMEADATTGICLPQCTDLNQPCAVPDPKYAAGCGVYWNSEIGKVHVCLIFCKLGSATYPCPSATGYECKSYGSDLGICVPDSD